MDGGQGKAGEGECVDLAPALSVEDTTARAHGC